jgi:uncharacterized protein (TIGR03086 family)
MAIELPEAHARALDGVHTIVGGVAQAKWDQASACEAWSVRELLNHIVSGNWWVAPLVEGQTIAEVGDRYDGDVLGDDPLAAYDASAAAAKTAFFAPDAMTTPVAVSYGPVPGEIYCGHRFIDVLVHGWDLASSTGQSTGLDPDLVTTAIAVIEPQIDLLSASGMFGSRQEVAADASDQDRLLAMLGRQP